MCKCRVTEFTQSYCYNTNNTVALHGSKVFAVRLGVFNLRYGLFEV